MEVKTNKISKRFLKEPLFKKYSNMTWKNAQNVIKYIFILL